MRSQARLCTRRARRPFLTAVRIGFPLPTRPPDATPNCPGHVRKAYGAMHRRTRGQAGVTRGTRSWGVPVSARVREAKTDQP